MSFNDISDPLERERVVQDYEKLKREIRERQERERMSGQNRYRTLQKTFHPIVEAQTNMTDQIVKALRDVPNERKIKEEIIIPRIKQRLDSDESQLTDTFKSRYITRDPDLDYSFGINFLPSGATVIANTPIKIEDDDFIIYNEVYNGTPGLWTLITEKNKENLAGHYDKEDLQNYEEILRQTNVLHKDFNPNSSYPRSSSSWKWKHILAPIWTKWREEEDDEKNGSGLIIKKYGRIWKAKRHHMKGFRKLKDGVYLRNGLLLHKL